MHSAQPPGEGGESSQNPGSHRVNSADMKNFDRQLRREGKTAHNAACKDKESGQQHVTEKTKEEVLKLMESWKSFQGQTGGSSNGNMSTEQLYTLHEKVIHVNMPSAYCNLLLMMAPPKDVIARDQEGCDRLYIKCLKAAMLRDPTEITTVSPWIAYLQTHEFQNVNSTGPLTNQQKVSVLDKLLRRGNSTSILWILGGNNSRTARQELLAEHPNLIDQLKMVPCVVYVNLNKQEMMHLSWRHNATREMSKAVCAVDNMLTWRHSFENKAREQGWNLNNAAEVNDIRDGS